MPSRSSAFELRAPPLRIAMPRPRFATEKPLLVLLLLGSCLRLTLHIGLWPTTLVQPDPWLYVNAAAEGIFSDPIHPAGYAILLRVLRPLSPDPVVVVALQHALGLVAAGLIYITARRLDASPIWSSVPAAVLALSLDQALVEHTLISDSVFIVLVVLVLYAVVRWAEDPEIRPWWLVVAGAVAASAMLVRASAPVLVIALIAAAAMAGSRSLARSILRSGAVLVGLALVAVPYLVAQHAATDRWALTEATGWSLYSRVAPFARCEISTPPPDTRFLCEETAPSDRGGPDFYAWGGGPARARYGNFDEGNDQLGRFALAVLIKQFDDYLGEVATDFVRYFSFEEGHRESWGGRGGSAIRINASWAPAERNTLQVLESYYGDIDPVRRDGILDALANGQQLLRVSRYPLLAASLFALVGIAVIGQRRRLIAFLMFVAAGSLLFSVAVTTYNWRYALPWIPFFFLAAALTGDNLAKRRGRAGEVIASGETDEMERGGIHAEPEDTGPEMVSVPSP